MKRNRALIALVGVAVVIAGFLAPASIADDFAVATAPSNVRSELVTEGFG